MLRASQTGQNTGHRDERQRTRANPYGLNHGAHARALAALRSTAVATVSCDDSTGVARPRGVLRIDDAGDRPTPTMPIFTPLMERIGQAWPVVLSDERGSHELTAEDGGYFAGV